MRVFISYIKCKETYLLSTGVVLHIGFQNSYVHESNFSNILIR